MDTVYMEYVSSGNAVMVTDPVFVYRQRENGRILRCERAKAQGILDEAGERICQIENKAVLEQARDTVRLITKTEYLSRLCTQQEEDRMLSAGEALEIIMGGCYETE